MMLSYSVAVAVILACLELLLRVVSGPQASIQTLFYPRGAPYIVHFALQYLLTGILDMAETVCIYISSSCPSPSHERRRDGQPKK